MIRDAFAGIAIRAVDGWRLACERHPRAVALALLACMASQFCLLAAIGGE